MYQGLFMRYFAKLVASHFMFIEHWTSHKTAKTLNANSRWDITFIIVLRQQSELLCGFNPKIFFSGDHLKDDNSQGHTPGHESIVLHFSSSHGYYSILQPALQKCPADSPSRPFFPLHFQCPKWPSSSQWNRTWPSQMATGSQSTRLFNKPWSLVLLLNKSPLYGLLKKGTNHLYLLCVKEICMVICCFAENSTSYNWMVAGT